MSYQATGWVLEFSEAQLGARLVLHSIAYHMNNETGLCYPSLETIAKECRMSRPGVIQAMERLEKSGELSVARGGGSGKVNCYSMPVFMDWWERAKALPRNGKQGLLLNGENSKRRLPLEGTETVNPIAKNSKRRLPEPLEPLREPSSSLKLSQDTSSIAVSVGTATPFNPPTYEAVFQFMTLRGVLEPNRQAELFIAHHANRRWRLSGGRGPVMRDWKMAVITWQENIGKFGSLSRMDQGGSDGKPGLVQQLNEINARIRREREERMRKSREQQSPS